MSWPASRRRFAIAVRRMPPEKTLRHLAGWIGLSCVAVGAVALIGWSQGIDPLGILRLNAAPMKPAAALCLALLGASLWLQLRNEGHARATGLVCAALVLVISAELLAHKWTGVNFGVDRLLAPNADAHGTRMSTHTAMVLGTFAIAHLLLGRSGKQQVWPLAVWLSNIVISVCAAGLLANEFATIPNITRPLRLSSHLSIALLILGCGTLLARPEDRQLRILFARTAAGMLARKIGS
jgi:hypothetical protein